MKNLDYYFYDDLILRLLDKKDLPFTLNWRNAEEFRMWFVTTNIISSQEHEKWFEQYQKKENDFIFMVTNTAGSICGQLAIYDIDWENKIGVFGRFLVNPAYSGQGLMKKALLGALKMAKDTFQLKELTLQVKSDNLKAIHIYEAGGFAHRCLHGNNMLEMHIKL